MCQLLRKNRLHPYYSYSDEFVRGFWWIFTKILKFIQTLYPVFVLLVSSASQAKSFFKWILKHLELGKNMFIILNRQMGCKWMDIGFWSSNKFCLSLCLYEENKIFHIFTKCSLECSVKPSEKTHDKFCPLFLPLHQ